MAIQNLKLMSFLICFSVGISAARAVISLIYTSELTMMANRSRLVVFCFFCLAIKLLISALHMEFAYTSYMIALYINILINLLTVPLLAWYVPESPYYLYSKGEMRAFYASLLSLHKMSSCWCPGGAPESELDIVALTELEPKKKIAGNVLTATRGRITNNGKDLQNVMLDEQSEALLNQ